MTLASGGGGSDIPPCGQPGSLSVHLASSAVTPADSVHKSRGAHVGAAEEMTKFILKFKTSFEAYKRYIYVQI